MRRELALALGAALVLPAASASAVVLQSGSGNYFAWEAEAADMSGGRETGGHTLITDANASGNQALQALTNMFSGTSPTWTEWFEIYDLQVTDAAAIDDASFKFYIRAAKPFDGDSFWRPSSLNVPVDSINYSAAAYPNTLPADGTYHWYESGSYNFGSASVGDVFDFVIKPREAGYILDRFVLHQTGGLDAATLDQLENTWIPEPASFALLGLGSLALFSRRLTR